MQNLVKSVQKNGRKMGGEVPETGRNKGNIGVSQECKIFILTDRKVNKNKAYRNPVTTYDRFQYTLFKPHIFYYLLESARAAFSSAIRASFASSCCF